MGVSLKDMRVLNSFAYPELYPIFLRTIMGINTSMGKRNGSIFTFVNDSIRDIRFIYGEDNDKLQFIISKES